MDKQKLQLIFAVVALGVAGVLIARQFMGGSDTEDPDQTTFWRCNAEGCGAEFTATLKETIAKANSDGNMPCPQCQKSLTMRALQCPACKGLLEPVGHGGYPETCIHCNAPVAATIAAGRR